MAQDGASRLPSQPSLGIRSRGAILVTGTRSRSETFELCAFLPISNYQATENGR